MTSLGPSELIGHLLSVSVVHLCRNCFKEFLIYYFFSQQSRTSVLNISISWAPMVHSYVAYFIYNYLSVSLCCVKHDILSAVSCKPLWLKNNCPQLKRWRSMLKQVLLDEICMLMAAINHNQFPSIPLIAEFLQRCTWLSCILITFFTPNQPLA